MPGINVANSVAVTVIVADWCEIRMPVGVTDSQAPPTAVAADACHVRVPPPELATVAVCGIGLGWPTIPLKASSAGVVAIIGVVGCPMMNVTGKVCVPADELRITDPRYVPGVSPVTLTAIEGWAGVTPAVVPILSQGPPWIVVTDALQCSGVEHP